MSADPGALITAVDKEPSFRANAPEAMGRLNISFAAKADVTGSGELAKLRFQVVGSAAGAPIIRLEALSLTGPKGEPVAAPLPPPTILSLTR